MMHPIGHWMRIRSRQGLRGSVVGAAGAILFGWIGALGSPASAQVALSEIQFDPAGINSGRQRVEIRNYGAAAVDIGGYWLSFRPADYRFPTGFTLGPQEVAVIHINRSGTDSTTELYTGIAGKRNLRPIDAVGLYTTNLFNDPTRLVDFVQWGGGGQAGEDVAVAAGQWIEGDFVVTTAHRPGSSIAYDGSGNRSTDWCVDGLPTLGALNDDCTPSKMVSMVRLNEVGIHDPMIFEVHSVVEIANGGAAPEDLGGFVLAAGTSTFEFAAGTLVLPGDLLTVHIGVGGTPDDSNLYIPAGFQRLDLARSGSLALFGSRMLSDPTWIADFVQWGASGQAFESQAAQAGLWVAGTSIEISGRVGHGSIASKNGASGRGSWWVDNTPTLGKPNGTAPVSPLIINEIQPFLSAIPEERQWIEIFNRGKASMSLAHVNLCVDPKLPGSTASCYEFPAGAALPSGGYLLLQINSAGADTPARFHTGPFPELRVDGDAVALLLTADVENPNNVLDYVRWGSGSIFLESLAVQAGLWPAVESIPTAGIPAGASISYNGSGKGPESFRIDPTPSPGATNKEPPAQRRFTRGDCAIDGLQDISDAVVIFAFLFLGGEKLLCQDACDGNDDGVVDISDGVAILSYLFLGSGLLPPPEDCGPDPTADPLHCDQSPICQP